MKKIKVLTIIGTRPEAITSGGAILVGTDSTNIIKVVNQLLIDKDLLSTMTRQCSPFGNGDASVKIVNFLESIF